MSSLLNTRRAFGGLMLLAAYGAPLAAEPVTFQLEAEVASVIHNNGGSEVLPEVNKGQNIIANFRFEDSSPGLNHPQNSNFEIVVSGVTYISPSYSITVRDNSSNWIPFPGTLADPDTALVDDRGPGGVSDTIWIGSIAGSSGDLIRV